MKTELLRFAAVCGVVCVLTLSTTFCSKPEAPPVEAPVTQENTATATRDTIATPINYVTYKQVGTITAGSASIDLNKWKVSGSVLSPYVSKGVGDTSLIATNQTISITSVQPWPGTVGTPPGGASQGLTEQSTKVSIVTDDTVGVPKR
jgi:hypothetical protein